MQADDMILVSVDDHVIEPGNLFDQHLPKALLATAPSFHTTREGKDYWQYCDRRIPSIALNAVAGRVPEEYGFEPTSLSQLRKGCYDADARIGDMNASGIAVSLNFASAVGLDGSLFMKNSNKQEALSHLKAYNDWHIEEWAGSHPGRFIPCAVLPQWDPQEMAIEIARIAAKGCTTISINDNPTVIGLPSIHNLHWEPLWKACVDHGIAINLHIGNGNPAPHASAETPIEAWITTMPMAIAVGAADWLNLSALDRYPELKIALAEGGIGWIPYFLERADFSHERHKAWTHSGFKDRKPSDVFRQHFLTCFVDDAFGLRSLEAVGEDLVAYECDYPHSDSLWPDVPERLWPTVRHLSDNQIAKVTHLNAMRFYNFDPFRHHAREDLTVGALRAAAIKAGVDTSPLSSGGAAPLAPGETPRPVTSGDVMRMFSTHAQVAEAVGSQ